MTTYTVEHLSSNFHNINTHVYLRTKPFVKLKPYSIGFFFLSLLFQHSWGKAQEQAYKEAHKLAIGKYVPQQAQQEKYVEVQMNLGEFEILNPWAVEVLETKKIDSIHLVYTDYPKSMDFTKLNQNRFEQLYALFPELAAEHYIKWSIFRQTNCKTLQEAKDYFHGFVVYYQNQPKPHLDPIFQKKRKAYFDKKFERLAIHKLQVSMGEDSTAYRAVERQTEAWKNIVFVCDWTGSMYPYSLQVLKWQIDKSTHKDVLGYIFFNDGDLKTTNEKELGNTGGIYESPNSLVFTVFDHMREAKHKGDGGDLPENDLEALLYAQAAFPEAKEIVLIADNLSPVRDLELLPQLTKPVRIILNRLNVDNVQSSLNEDYLQIALATGGSIHTDDADYITVEAIEKLKSDQLK